MKRRFTSQIFGGLILIGIGAMFLLRQLGYTDFSLGYLISNYWPVILILMGMKRLLGTGDEHQKGGSSPIGGFFFLAIGVFFLGRNLDWFDISAGDFFKMFIPIMLIGGGLYVIFKPRGSVPPVPPSPPSPPDYFPPGKSSLDVEPPKPLDSTLDEQFEQKFGKPSGGQDWNINLQKDEEEDEDGTGAFKSTAESRWQEKQERHERRRQERHERHARRHGEWHEEFHETESNNKESTNRSAFIGDVHMGREHFQLKNTNVSQFIGDTVLDLTNAQIAYGETKINISAFIGDIKVYIPNDMDLGISVNSSSFIGDMEVLDQSRSGFMSSVQCKTPYYKEAGKKVRINVSAFIGDIKVKTVG
ncbi:cell wall-active antibiotics response protein LiaF [Paenibacillus sp. B2(2019)]|uniref:cell wall-active antibiotics response protein LiaF n=1 Tax=Paenibacillus sp. B2(2019) TaxID=2607754 RepID=UPI0011F0B6B9|nr:cell wall-active antibiotics response protein LiaF [Paenibacillus sp. B2(2019)]KAA1186144.1 cell wall-active antibiotics response protein [Paenibacillus sp. B2(2019)]